MVGGLIPLYRGFESRPLCLSGKVRFLGIVPSARGLASHSFRFMRDFAPSPPPVFFFGNAIKGRQMAAFLIYRA